MPSRRIILRIEECRLARFQVCVKEFLDFTIKNLVVLVRVNAGTITCCRGLHRRAYKNQFKGVSVVVNSRMVSLRSCFADTATKLTG